MRELMLELLCYEPFDKFLPEEKKYIDTILSGNYQQPPSEVHDLFSGFYNYVQRANAQRGNAQRRKTQGEKLKDVDWLRIWRNTYHQKRSNTSSATIVRSPNPFPLLFRKICFYIIVRENFSDSEFTRILGMKPNVIQKWNISTQFRRYAEADTYSEIRLLRNGVKKEYIVSTIKKLYYEAGRQVNLYRKLNKLPEFVDVFAGSATVAASVVSESCLPPIVNDFDPLMVCFAWAFTHCQSEMRKKIAEFHNNLMKQDFASTNWSYDSVDYERYVEKNDYKNVHINPRRWDDPEFQWEQMFFYGATPETITEGKKLAQRHQEFIMRTRSSYKDNEKELASCNIKDLRTIKFNELSPHSIKQIKNVLKYAFEVFYQCSFALNNKVHHESAVDTTSYSSYLSNLQVNLDDIEGENCDVKAEWLIKLRLEADLLKLESTGHFSRYLQKAEFYCKDFRKLLEITPSDAIYYWDSPYYLTVGYDVDFSDKDHKDMLDILRNAKFKWMFSMQYNPSYRYWCTTAKDKAARKKQQYIIKDYGDYYRGFYAPFQLATDQRTYYVPTDAPMKGAEGLYVLLFDFEKVQQEWENMRNTETSEMLVVNFNPLRTIPLHDSAVVYPFDLFLKCADKRMVYQDIVKRAIAWRKSNIESKYTNEAPV